MPIPAYCTVTDVARAAAKFQALTAEETTRATDAIGQAQGQIETMTSAFFYQKHLQVITESMHQRQVKLFLPYPCISLDANGVTENGTVLVQGSDFLLYQPMDGQANPKGPGWIEKVVPSVFPYDFQQFPSFWTNNQQAVSISGQFGYAVVPPEIVKMTAWLAARLLGWITFTFTKADGVSKAAMDLGVPYWWLRGLKNWRTSHLDEQVFILTALA
jgi:hypothetical protein